MKQRKCIVCKPGSRRKAPHPGPRCTTHHREVVRARKRMAHGKRIEEVYNLSEEDYWRLYEFQGGRCWICQRATGAKRKLSIDHDHACCDGPFSCGECIRGLCCRKCNSDVLGHLRDNVSALERAIGYLKDPPTQRMRRQQMNPKLSEKDFWRKVEWEGGIEGAIDYGMRLDDFDLPPELYQLWERAENILEEIRGFMPSDI